MEHQIGPQGDMGDMAGTYDSNKGQFLTNLPFLKGLSQKKVQPTGQPPKRRGPKPDSKPAQTRRQELNRQAQRTHRERKEQYVRALENEVSRLREGYSELTKTSHTTNEQLKHALQAVMEENKILQHILRAHGIAFEHEIPTVRNMFGGPGPGPGADGGAGGGASGGRGGFGGDLGPSDGGSSNFNAGTGPSSHGMQYPGQGQGLQDGDGDGNMQYAMKMSATPSQYAAPSMTADNSISPSSGKFVSGQERHDTSPDLSQQQSGETTLGASTNTAADTSMASLDPNLSLSLEASTASTSILQPPPEDTSTMSYHPTMPLPPLTPEATFPSVQSGGSSTLNEVAWTGAGTHTHWDPIEKDEPIGAVPGAFEKDPQLELDFILTLESPCRNHMEFLNRRATSDPEQGVYCGHALMATCPPPTQIQNTPPGQQYPVETYDLPRASLSKLLNLSRQLVTEGQITPIMAVQNLKCHASYTELTAQDIRHMINDLATKIRCYGFGAVIEDFEFMDSLSAILSSKHGHGHGHGPGRDGVSGPGGRVADRYKQMFAHQLAAMNGQMTPDGRYIGGGGVAGPGMPQVDEFLFA